MSRVAAAFLFAFVLLPSLGGSIGLKWDAVPGAAGYKIYLGDTAPGAYVPNATIDVGNATTRTINNLGDCLTYYMAVKAYDVMGTESVAYSNEVSGWARPEISIPNPVPTWTAGVTVTVQVQGRNFMAGATAQTGRPAAEVTVDSFTVIDCNTATLTLTILPAAQTGPVSLYVVNPDRVFGTTTYAAIGQPVPIGNVENFSRTDVLP